MINISLRPPPLIWFYKWKEGIAMVYNHFKSRKKWNEWKKEEEEKLRKMEFNEDKIQELRRYDKDDFLKDRNFHTHENVTSDDFFIVQSFNINKEVNSIEEFLDDIENEALLEILKQQDKKTLNILLMKLNGYTVKEISEILQININTIYYKIKKIKNLINNLK